MEFDNIIPIGDHCVIAQVLRELNIRKKAYPFDWNCYKDMTDTSIRINFDIIDEITKNSIDDISRITKNMLNNTNIIFPHDNTSDENIISKYIKRMERLYNDITNGSKILYIEGVLSPISFEIVNSQGKIVQKGILLKNVKINDNLTSGIYFITLQNRRFKILIE